MPCPVISARRRRNRIDDESDDDALQNLIDVPADDSDKQK